MKTIHFPAGLRSNGLRALLGRVLNTEGAEVTVCADCLARLVLHALRTTVLAESVLDPETHGHAVSADVRDHARVVLGLDPVETRH